MVRLRRGSPPPGLLRNGGLWTKRWLAIHGGAQTGDWATAAAKKILSAELRALSYGKCAFCESILDLATYLEIEHYIAKTVDASLAFQWDNLFPICRLCNNHKSDADHGGVLIKPDVEDPENKFWLNTVTGELDVHPSLDAHEASRANRTAQLCGLQRGPLCSERIRTMKDTIRWVKRFNERGRQLDQLLREEWINMTDPATPYKFVIRWTLVDQGQPQLAGLDRTEFGTP
jgi:uncharacterized protein (TIGR02646 family)